METTRTKETKEDFVAGYLERSGMTEAKLRKAGLVAAPCSCEEPSCRGWRMAYRDAALLASKMEGLRMVE